MGSGAVGNMPWCHVLCCFRWHGAPDPGSACPGQAHRHGESVKARILLSAALGPRRKWKGMFAGAHVQALLAMGSLSSGRRAAPECRSRGFRTS